MFYIVQSNTSSIRDKIVSKVIESKNISEEDILIFDYEEKGDFELAFLEFLSINFDGTIKIVILKNAEFLNKISPEKNEEERMIKSFELKNNNILILTIDKLNKTGKINKKYNKMFQILNKEAPEKKELNNFIKTFFNSKNIKIDEVSINNIINRVGDNFDILITEINKLELLQNNNVIDNDMVEKTVLDFSRERLYKISEYTLALNEEKVIEIIKQLRSEGETIFLPADFLVKEFSKFLRYKILKEKDKSLNDNDIQILTGWNIWGIKNYSKYSNYWPNIEILSDFYYGVLLQQIYIEMILNSTQDPMKTLEKILVSNIIKVKEGNNGNK